MISMLTEQDVFKLKQIFKTPELVNIYANVIETIKTNYGNKTREEKALAVFYFWKTHIKNKSNNLDVENVVKEFFTIYDNKFDKYKNSFELIADYDDFLISFANKELN